jgi:hypothetical protein
VISPGFIDPDSFSSEEELKAALKKQGEDRGWTPLPPPEDDEPIAHSAMTRLGKSAVDSIFSRIKKRQGRG